MWTCPKCSESIQDTFDTCWNCGTSSDGIENPYFPENSKPPAPRAPGADGDDGATSEVSADEIQTAVVPEPRRCSFCGRMSEYPGGGQLFLGAFYCDDCHGKTSGGSHARSMVFLFLLGGFILLVVLGFLLEIYRYLLLMLRG